MAQHKAFTAKIGPTARKTKNGAIAGPRAVYASSFTVKSATAPPTAEGGYSPAADQVYENVYLPPVTPTPGGTAGGSGGSGGLVDPNNVAGLGFSFDQILAVYDRVQGRTKAPKPKAPGSSTGKPTKPDVAPAPSQTPKPAASGGAYMIAVVAALVLAAIGFALGGVAGLVVGLLVGAAGGFIIPGLVAKGM